MSEQSVHNLADRSQSFKSRPQQNVQTAGQPYRNGRSASKHHSKVPHIVLPEIPQVRNNERMLQTQRDILGNDFNHSQMMRDSKYHLESFCSQKRDRITTNNERAAYELSDGPAAAKEKDRIFLSGSYESMQSMGMSINDHQGN